MKAVLQSDHNDGIPQLDGVAAAGDDDLVAAGDAAEQQMGLEVKFAQGNAGGGALFRVLMLLPASFWRARTYWTMKSQVIYLG